MPKRYVLRCERNWILESESDKEEDWLVDAALGDIHDIHDSRKDYRTLVINGTSTWYSNSDLAHDGEYLLVYKCLFDNWSLELTSRDNSYCSEFEFFYVSLKTIWLVYIFYY